MPNDYEDDCPCNICEWDCDYWDAKYCCTLCRWKNGGEEPSWCDDCDPWDIQWLKQPHTAKQLRSSYEVDAPDNNVGNI